MKLNHAIAAVLFASTLAIACAGPAHAAADPSRYLLTATVMDKIKAAETDLRKAGEDARDDVADNPATVEDLARSIDRNPAARAALAKQGLSSQEFALASFALLQAGMWVMMEKEMDKKKAAQTLAGYTKEQKANIAFVRAMKQ